MAGGRGEQQQRLAECVELELLVDPVADDVRAAGIPGQVERALVGDATARRRVRGPQIGAVLEQAVAHEAHGIVEQRVGADLCDGLPGVALVADPDVAVVVVAPFPGTLGQRHGRRGDHAAAAARQAAEHGVGVARVALRDRLLELAERARARRPRLPTRRASGSGALGGASRRAASTSTRSWCSPSSRSSSSASSLAAVAVARGRARSPPPIQRDVDVRRPRRSSRPTRAARACGAARRRSRPRGFSCTSTRAVPCRAITRRRMTARSVRVGSASASRHSMIALSTVTQRLRQIRLPGS